jgi:hypothetical protein
VDVNGVFGFACRTVLFFLCLGEFGLVEFDFLSSPLGRRQERKVVSSRRRRLSLARASFLLGHPRPARTRSRRRLNHAWRALQIFAKKWDHFWGGGGGARGRRPPPPPPPPGGAGGGGGGGGWDQAALAQSFSTVGLTPPVGTEWIADSGCLLPHHS